MSLFDELKDKLAVKKQPKVEGNVLFVIQYGRAFGLCVQAVESMRDFLSDSGVYFSEEGFDFDGVGIDYDSKMEDGIYVGKLGFVSDGPSDWPGAGDEYVVSLEDYHPATEQEWKDHCEGCYPWDNEELDELGEDQSVESVNESSTP